MDDEFSRALRQVEEGLADMGRGDAHAYKACWADTTDSTLFGAWGTMERGRADIDATLDWVASRFSGGPLLPRYDVVVETGDTAWTVGSERGVVSVDGAPATEVTIRVTHIYRKTSEGWRILHRHGDHPPTLSRPPRLGRSSN